MFKDPQKAGKLISFSFALVLFIIANVILARINKKIKKNTAEISTIEKNFEANLSNLLIGKEEFSKGELYITLGMMTFDEIHQLSSIYTPVSNSMIRGLSSLKETLPDDSKPKWKFEIDDLEAAFKESTGKADMQAFMITFRQAYEKFGQLHSESETYNAKLANQKQELKNELSSLSASSNLLLTINSVILLIQLFFTNLFDLFFKKKKESQ